MVDWAPEYKPIGYLHRDVSAGFSPQPDIAEVDAVFTEESENYALHLMELQFIEATSPLPTDAWLPSVFFLGSVEHPGWFRGENNSGTAVIVGDLPSTQEEVRIIPVYGTNLSDRARIMSVKSWRR
jgi:hypothetical protein